MTKYKLISKASTSGYKKIEEDILINCGFPEVGLLPVEYNGEIFVPTGYARYKELDAQEVKKDD